MRSIFKWHVTNRENNLWRSKPSYDGVGQFPKTRRKVGLVTCGRARRRNQSRLYAPDASDWNWNTETPVTFVQTERRGPNDTHELFILTSFSSTVLYRYRRPAVTGNIVRQPCTSLSLALISHRTKAHLVWHCEIPGFHKAHHVQVRRKYVLY